VDLGEEELLSEQQGVMGGGLTCHAWGREYLDLDDDVEEITLNRRDTTNGGGSSAVGIEFREFGSFGEDCLARQ
jgi:hypothetical protein